MSQLSGTYNVNGLQNFSTWLRANGYTGTDAIYTYQIKNASTVDLRFIVQGNKTPPASPATKGDSVIEDVIGEKFQNGHFLDAGQVFLYTASAIDIEINLTGGGL